MKICYFGNFNPNYSRNRVIIRGLKENGVEILFANTSLRGWRGLADLGKKYFSLKSRFDAVLVGYSDSRFMVPFIKLISDKKIIWDAFYSIYDSWVFDRKLVKPGSLKARYYWLSDWLSCKLADKILLDTNANIEYFKETFNVDVSKFTRVFVGTDDNIFKPELIIKNNEKFIVHFHGNFIPLQGIEYIIKAAGILIDDSIHFQIIGQGQEYKKIKKIAEDLYLKNITWTDRVDYKELPNYINRADICLGGFGDTHKAKTVSMNKLFEYLACGKAIITGDSLASREILTDGDTAILCPRANPGEIANKIIQLKIDSVLLRKLSLNARKLFEERYVPKIITGELLKELKNV